MALLGSNITGEVGLRLLLCPLGSNIVVRTACCSVGIVLPIYRTFKAIERKDQDEQQRCLLYWAAYGSFSLLEVFSDRIISWLPFYYHLKFAFLVWLQFPSVDGAKHLYMCHLRPFLLQHQARIDRALGFAYGEMVKFICAHKEEIQFARTVFSKIVTSVDQMFKGVDKPALPQGRRLIEDQSKTEDQSRTGDLSNSNDDSRSEDNSDSNNDNRSEDQSESIHDD